MDPFWLLLIVPTSVLVGVFAAYYANTYKGMDEDGPRVTPSCGCILCDLKIPRAKDNGPGFQTFFHNTQHGPIPCPRNF